MTTFGPLQVLPLWAQTTFGPDRFRAVSGLCKRWAPKGGAPNCWAPKGAGPNLEKVGPEGCGPQISLFFFSLSPATIFFLFFSLLGVVSLNFGGVFEGWDPQMCTFGVLGLSCEAPVARSGTESRSRRKYPFMFASLWVPTGNLPASSHSWSTAVGYQSRQPSQSGGRPMKIPAAPSGHRGKLRDQVRKLVHSCYFQLLDICQQLLVLPKDTLSHCADNTVLCKKTSTIGVKPSKSEGVRRVGHFARAFKTVRPRPPLDRHADRGHPPNFYDVLEGLAHTALEDTKKYR